MPSTRAPPNLHRAGRKRPFRARRRKGDLIYACKRSWDSARAKTLRDRLSLLIRVNFRCIPPDTDQASLDWQVHAGSCEGPAWNAAVQADQLQAFRRFNACITPSVAQRHVTVSALLARTSLVVGPPCRAAAWVDGPIIEAERNVINGVRASCIFLQIDGVLNRGSAPNSGFR
jgi:hypothetical protein